MKKLLSFILVSCVLSLRLKHRYPPQNPVIGIYTQAHDEDNNLNTNTTYIAASYVKFIEMSGAQVVPIYSFSETRQVLNLMEKVNGVLFTGGGLKKFDISDQWTKNAEAILNFAKTQNDNNNPFPIFGTCQGLELLCYLTSNYNHSILAQVHGDRHTILPIRFVSEGYIFQTMSQLQRVKMEENQGILYFNHNWALTLETFNDNPLLNNFWDLVATSLSHKNQIFVAALQSKKYPFYLVHFHPQKNPYEWIYEANRTLQAIQVTQIISNRFVEIARKNKNRFSSLTEFTQLSIYNFLCDTSDDSFTQIYIFDESFQQ